MSTPGGSLTGREIAGYRLLHVLGAGGASEVYLSQRLDDPTALAAIKVLMPSWQLPPDERKNFHARFLREAQAAQRLNHPHILPVLAYGEEDEITYMVLPFMTGGTLATRLGNAPRGLPLAQVARYLEQIADALDYAHEQGIVHRDIKSTNVLLDAQDQLYLADFGIARLFALDESGSGSISGQPATTLTVTGQILGTPVYMAPEQVLSARVGPAADVYSLGILLYQMVTGIVPFEAETPVGLAMQHVQEPPAAPHLRRADLPPPAEAAILTAIAKSPEARFASAHGLARAFAAGLTGTWTEGLASAAPGRQTTPNAAPTVVATPPPTLVATPPPSPYLGGSHPQQAQPYQPYPPLPDSRRRRGGGLFAVLGVLVVLLVVGTIVAMQVLSPNGSGVTSAGSLTPTADPSTVSSTPVVTLFQSSRRYTYNSAIGHSKPNAVTNSDVSVVLVSLDLRGPSATSRAVVSFYDADSQKSAHFLFQTRANIYLVDQNGVRYQAVSVTPNQVIMGPGQGGSVTVAFPPVSSDVSALYFHFNTDYQALDTPCATLTPTSAVSGCPTN